MLNKVSPSYFPGFSTLEIATYDRPLPCFCLNYFRLGKPLTLIKSQTMKIHLKRIQKTLK